MKTEFYMHPEKGICLLISGFESYELNSMGISNGSHPLVSNPNRIAAYIRESGKIQAIKELRGQTGWGLRESKEYIDKYMPISGDCDFNEAANQFISDHTLTNFLNVEEMKI